MTALGLALVVGIIVALLVHSVLWGLLVFVCTGRGVYYYGRRRP
jgi:hypothetical protein